MQPLPETIIRRIHPRVGSVQIVKEINNTYTVQHTDLYRVYSVNAGFKTFKAAQREMKAMVRQ